MTNSPLVSIIIATKNEQKNIEQCIQSLRLQTYKNIEIIVIDALSSDNTPDIAIKYADIFISYDGKPNFDNIKNIRGAQINFGVKISKGDIIFFPDADMTFDPSLLSEAVQLITQSKYDALYVPEIVLGFGYFGKIRNFERSFYNSTCIDAVRIIRKNIFESIQGFDEKLLFFGPDDWDLTNKVLQLTKHVAITTTSLFHHEESLTVGAYLQKKYFYMKTFYDYKNKWKNNDKVVNKQLGFYYRYIGVFIERKKWIKLLKYPLLTLGMCYIRVIIGLVYIYYIFRNKIRTKFRNQ